MLFLSPKKDVMLERNEWHNDSLGSTAEISLFMFRPSFFSFADELDLLEAEVRGFWAEGVLWETGVVLWDAEGVMSFLALVFFLLERLILGGFWAGALRTALIIGVSLTFLNWELLDEKLEL